jgi:hypothetical protein
MGLFEWRIFLKDREFNYLFLFFGGVFLLGSF